jgi:hypothetical protein
MQFNNSKEQTTTVYRYEVLAMESDSFNSGNKLKRGCKNKNKNDNKLEYKTTRQKANMMYNDPCCSGIKESHDEINSKISVQHNFQKPKINV